MTDSRLPAALAARGWTLDQVFQENARFGVYFLRHASGVRGFLKVLRENSASARHAFAAERATLQLGRIDPPAVLPELLDASEAYYLTRFHDGERLRPESEPTPGQIALLVRTLSALRCAEFPNPSAGPSPASSWRRLALKSLPALAPDCLSRAEVLQGLARAMRLGSDLETPGVMSHGDFTLTNLIWEPDRVVLTDLESIDTRRNAFVDPLQMAHHAPVRLEDWTWQRELIVAVIRDRQRETGSTHGMVEQLEAATFFPALHRTLEAFVWDGRPSPFARGSALRWLRPGRPLETSKGQLGLRLETLRLMLDSATARRWALGLIEQAQASSS